MTLEKLIEITKDLPRDARLMSDSGWECDATDCDGIYYSPKSNTIVLTQGHDLNGYNDWILIRDSSGGGTWEKGDWITLFNEVKHHDY